MNEATWTMTCLYALRGHILVCHIADVGKIPDSLSECRHFFIAIMWMKAKATFIIATLLSLPLPPAQKRKLGVMCHGC